MSNSVKWAITMAIAAACAFAIGRGLRDPRVDDVWRDDEVAGPGMAVYYEARIADLEARLQQCEKENAFAYREIGTFYKENPTRWRERLEKCEGRLFEKGPK